ncbi:NIPA-like protein, partial [Mucuna pruriens]
MAQDSEKRFHSIMDKLFHPPKPPSTSSSSGVQLSGSRKRPYQSGVMELNRRGDVAEGQQSSSAAGTALQGPLCRPWDRGDFMRRLATFKSMSWFAKPKIVSAVNCASRGWINVDIDTIACEACGARLLFSTSASWNQQQVEKAALVFSLKLDNGHKLLCPWIDNSCNETLARFPPTTPPILVDNFRERSFALLQLSALPRISSSTIDYMQSQSPLLEEFLAQSLMLEYGSGSAENSGIGDVSSQEELKLYYQAQKIISLCGWKLRPLPYVVDWKDISDQSLKNSSNLLVHSAGTDENLKADENSKDSSIGEQMDPNSVVLDCTLCGATIGLWAFCTVPRPVELIRLVGYAEVNGENALVAHNLLDKNDCENRQGVNNTMPDVANSSKDTSSSLNVTIAGGPPPTKQNFKAIISLPVIGHNLRARLSCDSNFRDHVYVDRGGIQSDLQKEKTDNTANASIGQFVHVSSEIREISNYETGSQLSIHDSDVIAGTHYAGQSSALKDKMPVHTDADRLNSSAAGYPSSSQKDSTEGEVLSLLHKTLDGEVGSLENYGVKDREENPTSSDDVHSGLGKFKNPILSDKAMEFDPIRQHRHFCPWIASINDGEPGWKQTLSALYHQKNHLPHLPNRSPSSMPIVQVDDPVGSIRKLFMSPPTKRMKPAHITDQNT